jgi:hypothetical protein
METLLIYVPKNELKYMYSEDGSINPPSEYWLSKPSNWGSSDLATISIPIHRYNEWVKTSSAKELLKG